MKTLKNVTKSIKKISGVITLLRSRKFLVRRLQTRFVMRETKGNDYSVLVDVGVGEAPYRKLISSKKYIGIDIEDRGGIEGVLLADVNDGIPLPDNIADLVLCVEVLEHTRKPEFVISELFRVAKKGGKILLTVPMVWPIHEAPNDYFRFTNFGLQHIFECVGFEYVRVEQSNGPIYSLLQLMILQLRSNIWRPLVFTMNVFGYGIENFERNNEFPLVQHLVAIK